MVLVHGLEIFYIILGALCYRFRGQAKDSVGTFLGRLPWCLLVALITFQHWWQMPIIIGLAYVGVMFGYFGGKFDLADKNNRHWENYLRLSVRGGFIIFPVYLLMGHWLAVLAGSLFVVYYFIGLSTGGSKFPLIGDLLIGATIMAGLLW